MDPATIVGLTGICYTIAQHATGLVQAINNLRTRYRDVDLRVAAINAQTGIVRTAVNSLQTWLHQNAAVLEEDERRDLLQSVQACDLLISTLRRAAENATRRINDRSKTLGERWRRWRFVWDQRCLDLYARDLNNQAQALDLYLQTLIL